jgi:hypothetical protein
MTYPKTQWCVMRTRGNVTECFYGTRIGPLVMENIQDGDKFRYAKLAPVDGWATGQRLGSSWGTIKSPK